MRIIPNIIMIGSIIFLLSLFWWLVMQLWQPKRKKLATIVYILVILNILLGIRYYIIYQVDIYYHYLYTFWESWRTGTYGVFFGFILAIPILAIISVVTWLVNRMSKNVDPAVGRSRRKLLRTAAVAIPMATTGASVATAISGQDYIETTYEQFDFPNLPAPLRNYKMVQISDVHMGPSIDLDDVKAIFQRVIAERPDRLIITGDLIDKLDWLPALCAEIRNLAQYIPDGIDYILGNHEHFRNVDAILDAFRTETPMRILINESEEIFPNVYLAGVDYDLERDKTERESMLDQALSGIPKDAFVILLAHHPEFFDQAQERHIPLTLSGHTHGGQINVLGEPVVPVGTPYVKGRYTSDDGTMYCYVNNGTGHWFPVRVNCPREITVITFGEK